MEFKDGDIVYELKDKISIILSKNNKLKEENNKLKIENKKLIDNHKGNKQELNR